MIKSEFKDEPIDILEICENERYLYVEICELKKELKEIKKLYKKIDEYFGG